MEKKELKGQLLLNYVANVRQVIGEKMDSFSADNLRGMDGWILAGFPKNLENKIKRLYMTFHDQIGNFSCQ